MDKKHKVVLTIVACLVLGSWAATPFVVERLFPNEATRQGTFGDLYGSINSLFSGLALLGVIAAIMLQQKELSLSTRELKNSARALQKQVELSADASRLQVLPELIRAQKSRIETIVGDNFAEFEFSEKALKGKIENNKNRIRTLQKAIVQTELSIQTLHGLDKAEAETRLNQFDIDLKKQVAATPEFEQLLSYQTDLVQLYQKIANTRLDSD